MGLVSAPLLSPVCLSSSHNCSRPFHARIVHVAPCTIHHASAGIGCWRAGKDYDPDRERSEAKRLRRQLQKERRGAMRELRKDAAFLGEV